MSRSFGARPILPQSLQRAVNTATDRPGSIWKPSTKLSSYPFAFPFAAVLIARSISDSQLSSNSMKAFSSGSSPSCEYRSAINSVNSFDIILCVDVMSPGRASPLALIHNYIVLSFKGWGADEVVDKMTVACFPHPPLFPLNLLIQGSKSLLFILSIGQVSIFPCGRANEPQSSWTVLVLMDFFDVPMVPREFWPILHKLFHLCLILYWVKVFH